MPGGFGGVNPQIPDAVAQLGSQIRLPIGTGMEVNNPYDQGIAEFNNPVGYAKETTPPAGGTAPPPAGATTAAPEGNWWDEPVKKFGLPLLERVGQTVTNDIDYSGLPSIENPTWRNRHYARKPLAEDFANRQLQHVNVEMADIPNDRWGLSNDSRSNLGSFRGAHSDLANRYRLSGENDFWADRAKFEQAYFNRAANLMRPEFDRQQDRLNTDLVNRGLPGSGEAYQTAQEDFARGRDRAFNDLALGAVQAGAQEHQRLSDLVSRNRGQEFGERQGLFGAGYQTGDQLDRYNQAQEAEHHRRAQRQLALRAQQEQEHLNTLNAREGMNKAQEASWQNQFARSAQMRQQSMAEMLMRRNQPLTDLNSLLTGAIPGGMPQFPQFTQYAVQAPDYMGMAGSNYAARAQAHAATLGGLFNMAGGLFGGRGR